MFAKAFPYSFVHYRWAAGFGVNNVIAGIHVLFAQNLTVICPGCGKDLIVRYVYYTLDQLIFVFSNVVCKFSDLVYCQNVLETNFRLLRQ